MGAQTMPPLQEQAMELALSMVPISTGLRSPRFETSHSLKRGDVSPVPGLSKLLLRAMAFLPTKGALTAAATMQQSGSGSVDLHLLVQFFPCLLKKRGTHNG